MSSNDRFYQLEFKDRPVFHGDIGSVLKISGIIVSGGGVCSGLLLPSFSGNPLSEISFYELNEEEWDDFIKRSDDPEILIGPEKVFHRKVRYEISGAIQQKIWAADEFKCKYCGRKMGDVQLTVDHFMPLELGGKNDTSNYLSACRKCNKDKGNNDPAYWCLLRGISYPGLALYLKNRKLA